MVYFSTHVFIKQINIQQKYRTMHRRQACWHLDRRPVVPGRDLEVGQDRNASTFSFRVKTFQKYKLKWIENSLGVISLVCSAYIFRPQQNNTTLSLSVYTVDKCNSNTLYQRIWLKNLLRPVWVQFYLHDKARGKKSSLQTLEKQPGTRNMQGYERHQRNLPEKWRCSLFASLFRFTQPQRQEESLQNVSYKRSCTLLSAVALSSCVLVREETTVL